MGHRNRGKSTLEPALLALCIGLWLLTAGPTIQAGCLEVDGNGQEEALTDGLLTIRHLFGLSGGALTSGALGSGATRDAAAIAAYLDGLGLALDIDGNGTTEALTDGLLAIRHMFGLSGTALTSGALGNGATRTDPQAIAQYIDACSAISIPETAQRFTVQMPAGVPAGTSLVSFFSESPVSVDPGGVGSAATDVPAEHYSFSYVVDAADNIIGMYYGPSGSGGLTVDAVATAVALVMSLPIDWSDYGYTIPQMLQAIPATSAFPALVAAIEQVMDSAPATLLDDPAGTIYPALEALVAELTTPGPAARAQDLGVGPQDLSLNHAYLEARGNNLLAVNNPRYVPYGISSAELTTGNLHDYSGLGKRPYWVPGRKWLDLILRDEESVDYDLKSGEYLTCLAKQDNHTGNPALDALTDAFDLLGEAQHGEIVVPYYLLWQHLTQQNLPLSTQVLADAYLKGSLAFSIEATVTASGFFPGAGTAASIIIEAVYRAVNDVDIGVLSLLKSTAVTGLSSIDGYAQLLEYLYKNRTTANSVVRYIAKLLGRPGTQIRSIGLGMKMLSKVLGKIALIGGITDALTMYKDVNLAQDYVCYGVEVAADGTITIGPDVGTTIPLNDTGIVACANVTTNGLTCPVADYPWQDAENGRDATHNDDSDGHAGFSFTKLDADGNDLPTSATEWFCVRDNVTGYVWEVKTNEFGLRNTINTYSWYNPDPSTNGGSSGTQNGRSCGGGISCNTYSYVQAVNAQGLCGANDWYLPDRRALLSIVTNDRFDPSVDSDYFPNTLSSGYWSSVPYAYRESDSWLVSFRFGDSTTSGKGDARYVRLVRDGR